MAIANKENDNGVVEFQFRQRNERTKWQSFQRAIYDPSTGQFCGRTSKSWGQLLIFYGIFYIILAALFAICMQGLFATLNDKVPKWTLDSSLIGTNPGLGFRPISNRTEEGSLIWYNTTNQTTSQKWIEILDEFFEPYSVNRTADNIVQCNFNHFPSPDQVCAINLNQFKNCGPDSAYGYNSTSPCVFLKLNRIFDWVPDYYTEPHPDMPDDLKDYITSLPSEEKKQIWISCYGESDVDKEHVTSFNYYPKGFAGYHYPYKNIDNYLSPIIAVEILDAKPNVVVSVECRAWAKNIIYRGGNLHRAGSVKFEILIDVAAPPKLN